MPLTNFSRQPKHKITMLWACFVYLIKLMDNILTFTEFCIILNALSHFIFWSFLWLGLESPCVLLVVEKSPSGVFIWYTYIYVSFTPKMSFMHLWFSPLDITSESRYSNSWVWLLDRWGSVMHSFMFCTLKTWTLACSGCQGASGCQLRICQP